MRATVKFPALMVALPPRHKNPRIAVCAFDTSVEIPEVYPEDFPVAISFNVDDRTVEYRLSAGKLYLKASRTIKHILKRHAENVLDRRSWNETTGAIIRDMYRGIEKISDPADQCFWPAGAKRMLGAGMNTEWSPVKQVLSETQGLRLSGPWLDKARQTERFAPFLDQDQDARVARYESMTKNVFSAMRILDDEVWLPTSEPCYVVQQMPEGGYGRCMQDSFEIYAVTSDNHEDRRSWWNELSDRAFSILERRHITDNMIVPNMRIPEFTVHIGEALTADIPALEMDRCARVLINKFSRNAFQRDAPFQLPSTQTAAAFSALVELTRSYDPFDGVPDELDVAVQSLVSSIDRCERDHHLVPERDRRAADGYLERWADRGISFDLGSRFTP